MRKGYIIAFVLGLTTSLSSLAQEVEQATTEQLEKRLETVESELLKLNKLKVSGYIQGQYQHGEPLSKLNVGGINEHPEESYNRIGIRRGRIKFAYEEGIATGVFQIDLTEKGVFLKDLYLTIKDPWFKSSAFQIGVFNRPFGHEVSYSSSRRESPERATILQALFPDERDMGAMLALQASKTSPLNFLKLEAGLFAGNGIKQETDNRRDFIGHLSALKPIGHSATLGGGVSYYNGSVYQGTANVYTMQGDGFVLDSEEENIGRYAKREYIGFDVQLSITSLFGQTQLKSEYLFGQQPGIHLSSRSPNTSILLPLDTYIRDFSGGYVMFVQDIGRLPFSAVVKYDWYDPNTGIAGNNIGLNQTGIADLLHDTWGFGGVWRINHFLRMQAYYEINKNEQTTLVEELNHDFKNNVFTLRLQYKF